MSPEAPLFSIILPCYNRAELLPRSVGSVIDQEFTSWELIVVDDGSTDSTRAYIESVKDPRVKYIYQNNAERGAARNAGIKAARGTFVCFLDSDDYYVSNHLKVASDVINFNPEVHIFHQGYSFLHDDGSSTPVKELPLKINRLLVKENIISCNAIFISRPIFDRFSFSEERALSGTEDYLLWLKLAAIYPIRHIPVITSVIVNHTSRSMAEANFKKLQDRIYTFIHLVEEDRTVVKFIGLQWPKFRSLRYSYIALHAAVDGYKKEALDFLKKTLRIYPLFIFTKRFAIIMKYIFSINRSAT